MLLVFLCLCFASQGISAAEFNVDFVKRPALLSYSEYYGKYELTLELKITEVGNQSPGDKRVVTGMNLRADKGTSHPDFGATLMARVLNGGTDGQLVFLCSSLRRCLHIRNQIVTSPSFIQHALEFAPYGLQAGLPTQFQTVRSASVPALGPVIKEHSDVVFQRHLDNSLSFAQNWEAYANGFGDPSGNYWMGLEQLTTLTKDRNCKLTVKVTIFSGSVLSSTFKDFQVHSALENYRLRVGDKDSGGQLNLNMKVHDKMEFSTFDRDNDKIHEHCPKEQGGNSGWWYNNCHNLNPNAQIVSETDLSSTQCWKQCGMISGGKDVCLKRTELSFRCS